MRETNGSVEVEHPAERPFHTMRSGCMRVELRFVGAIERLGGTEGRARSADVSTTTMGSAPFTTRSTSASTSALLLGSRWSSARKKDRAACAVARKPRELLGRRRARGETALADHALDDELLRLPQDHDAAHVAANHRCGDGQRQPDESWRGWERSRRSTAGTTRSSTCIRRATDRTAPLWRGAPARGPSLQRKRTAGAGIVEPAGARSRTRALIPRGRAKPSSLLLREGMFSLDSISHTIRVGAVVDSWAWGQKEVSTRAGRARPVVTLAARSSSVRHGRVTNRCVDPVDAAERQ
jgi:hypothetical protein